MSKDLVLVATRAPLPGQSLKGFLLREKRALQVALVHDGAEALDFILECKPGLVIMDPYLPTMSGAAILEELHRKNLHPPVICFCTNRDLIKEVDLAKRGSRGIIDYAMDIEEVHKIITRVLQGRRAYPEEVEECLDSRDYEFNRRKYTPITRRQVEVMHLTAEGLSNAEIAYRLSICEKTVEKHKTHLKEKLGLESSLAIALYALTHNYIEGRRDSVN